MTNALAIAAVTRALRRLLERGVSGDFSALPDDMRPAAEIVFTTLPPDRARQGDTSVNQVNLFLYETVLNAAWRNQDLPAQARPGEMGFPPLPLNLRYLVTAYGEGENDLIAHLLLGHAMRALHDHPLLGRAEIGDALGESELQHQVERVRISAQPLSLEDMSRLWSGFQTQYRLSAAYEVAVVLIESDRAAVTPLPVVARGRGDQGVAAQADLTPPFPTLTGVQIPGDLPGVRLGDTFTLVGHQLDGDNVTVRFVHRRLGDTRLVPPPPLVRATATAVELKAPSAADDPAAPANWPAGFYLVSAVVQKAGEPDRVTNELALPLLPRIASPLPMSVARDLDGTATITLDCEPEVRPGQRAALLLGGREIVAGPVTTSTGSLIFVVPDALAGDHWIRLRIDGVDSQLVDRSTKPPSFDPTQRVTIT